MINKITGSLKSASLGRYEFVTELFRYICSSNKLWWTVLVLSLIGYFVADMLVSVKIDILDIVLGIILVSIFAVVLISRKIASEDYYAHLDNAVTVDAFIRWQSDTLLLVFYEFLFYVNIVSFIFDLIFERTYLLSAFVSMWTWFGLSYCLAGTYIEPKPRKKIRITMPVSLKVSVVRNNV